MARKWKKKSGNEKKITVLPGIWHETLKNVENDQCTQQDLKYGEKTENHGKCEIHIVGLEICRETMKNGKHTL